MTLELWCDGTPLSTYGAYGDLSPQFQWGPQIIGGLYEVDWTQQTLADAKVVPPGYIAGQQLELRDSGVPLGQCIIETVDFNTGSFTAFGVAQAPSKLTSAAADSSGAPVYSLRDAIQNGITAGDLPGWRDPGDLDETDLRTIAVNPLDGNTRYDITDVIEATCRNMSATTRCWLDAAGFPRFAEDPTTPTLLLNGVAPFGLSSSNYVRKIITDYQTLTVDPESGAFVKGCVVSTRPTPSGLIGTTQPLDITAQGSLTEAEAQASSDDALARMLPDFDRSGSASVAPRQVTTLDGTPIPLSLVQAGALVRHPGARSAGGAMIPGLADEWNIATIAITSTNGRITGATLTPMTSSTNVLQQAMSTAVQAQIIATQAATAIAAQVAASELAALIQPDSPFYDGTIPAEASVGDCLVYEGSPYICVTAYTGGDGSLTTDWALVTDPRTAALVFAQVATASTILSTTAQTVLSTSAPSGTPPGDGWHWVVKNGDGNQTQTWVSADGAWTGPVLADPTFIAELDAAVVNAVQANFESIWSDYIAANQITAQNVSSASGSNAVNIGSAVISLTSSGVTDGEIYGAGGGTFVGDELFTHAIRVMHQSGGSWVTPADPGYGGIAAQVVNANEVIAGAFDGGGLYASGVPSSVSGYNASGVYFTSLSVGGSPISAYVGGSGQLLSASSTRRFKTEVRSILDRYPRSLLRQVAGVLFRWIGHPDVEDGIRAGGFIAEQLAALGMEELVARNQAGEILTVRYDVATAFCWALTNDAHDRADVLEANQSAILAALAAAGITVTLQEAA